MELTDLQFDYPDNLVAVKPERPSRVMWVEGAKPLEISLAELLERIPAGDILVVNETKVLKRRVFAEELEIVFLRSLSQNQWEVLFPSRKYKIGDEIALPLGLSMKLVQKGRPQIVEVSRALTEADFEQFAELPLPPYIQDVRGQRHALPEDEKWYQTAWAIKPGSLAAPTASLHFSEFDIELLRARGVKILTVTLHVGLGTFLPVTTEKIEDHQMHFEDYEISASAWAEIQMAKKSGRKIWAMGTTVTRTLESAASGKLSGSTNLFVLPGFEWQVVDRLLTNFHQPESTLLALVAAFSDLKTVKACYQWAIERRFRLFSYGDLSVWIK